MDPCFPSESVLSFVHASISTQLRLCEQLFLEAWSVVKQTLFIRVDPPRCIKADRWHSTMVHPHRQNVPARSAVVLRVCNTIMRQGRSKNQYNNIILDKRRLQIESTTDRWQLTIYLCLSLPPCLFVCVSACLRVCLSLSDCLLSVSLCLSVMCVCMPHSPSHHPACLAKLRSDFFLKP